MQENIPVFILPKAAATRYSVSLATINRALARGELTRLKRGSATLIEVAEADAWARGDTPAAADSHV